MLLIALAGEDICFPLHKGSDCWAALRTHPHLQNGLLTAVLKKTADAPFVAPMQGMFADQSPQLKLANMPRRRVPQLHRNVALKRPALQSSTSAWSWHEDPAVDAAGGNDGQVTGYFSFHTEFERNPWWRADLGELQPITQVYVYNRLDDDAVARRAAHLCLSLSEDDETWRTVFERTEDAAFGGADGDPLRVDLNGEKSRYVRISLAGEGYLHLDEVEVY